MKTQDLINFLNRAIQPLKQRVLLMIGRALIKAVNDAAEIQELQVKSFTDGDRVQRFQEFGFTSNPPDGTEAIMVALGGNQDNPVIIATEHRSFRKKNLAQGESAIYNKDGSYILLKSGGKIQIFTSEGEDLIVCLSDLLARLKVVNTFTAIGPQPFTPVDIADLTALKIRIDKFKV